MGSVAYYRTPGPKRSKLGARAMNSVFIGYANKNKAYRLLDGESCVNVESKDMVLFKDKF